MESNHDIYFMLRPNIHQYVGSRRVLGKVLMLFVESGEASFTIDGSTYLSDSDHMFFLHPHAEVCLEEASSDYRCVVVGLPHVMQETATLQMDLSFFLMLLKNPSWELDERMREMVRGFYTMFDFVCHDLDSDYKTDLITTLFVFFLKVLYERIQLQLPTHNAGIASINSRSLVSRFGKLLRKHFREAHRVAFYADQLCVTPKYLTQVVKATIGVTPKDIIDRVLAMESLHQLKQSNLSVQQISNMLGFPDQSYFGRFFKRIFKISPLQFRQNPNMDILHKLDENMLQKYPGLENVDPYSKLKDFRLKVTRK